MEIVVRVPTEEEEDRARRFQVHHHYVEALMQYAETTRGAGANNSARGVVEAQRGLKSFRKIGRRVNVNATALTNYLTLSWASEVQLSMSRIFEPSLLKYSNAWAPVHAYYAVYMSVHAWFMAMGIADAPENHTATLNTVSNQVAQRGLFPAPWCVTCEGCPELKEVGYGNVPRGANLDDPFEILEAPTMANFWPRFATLLRTTRQRRLERVFKEWKRQRGRQRMFKREKRAVAEQVPCTTLFDFFWRLRVRANYRDVKAFLFSYVGDTWQREFNENIATLTSTTCALLQSLVVQYVGAGPYQAAFREFERAQRADVPVVLEGLRERQEILLG